MKITKTKLALFLLCLFSFGLYAEDAQDTDGIELEIEDSDDDSETEITLELTAETDDYDDSDEYNSYDEAVTKKKKNGFTDVLSNILKSSTNNFIEYDSSEVTSVNSWGKLIKQEAILVNLEGTDYYGFGSNYSMSFTYLLFDEKTRNQLKYAAKQYLSDFENKKLERKGKNTYRKYGESPVKITWGSVKIQAKNTGISPAKFGYLFKDNSPYFVITCPEAENEKYKISTAFPRASNYTQYYFTKAELKSLVDFISDENIEAMKKASEKLLLDVTPDTDSY